MTSAANYAQIALPGGATACCLNSAEARYILGELPDYFTHGIEVNAGDVVFDIGANIGLFSLWVHDRFDRDIEIYAFEPVRPIFEVLDLNRVRSGNVKLRTFPFGLSKECTTVAFTFFPREPALSSALSNRSRAFPLLKCDDFSRAFVAARKELGFPLLWWIPASIRPRILGFFADLVLRRRMNRVSKSATAVQCDLRTLSHVIREHRITRIDLLKIDVEGAELDVLSGIEGGDWQIIQQVVAEVESYSRDSVVVSRVLSEQGFSAIVLSQNAAQKEMDIGLVFARRDPPAPRG